MKLSYYTYQFRHYLGRNLTRAEAAVIGPLEIMRIRRRQRRLLVIDPPGVDSRGILIQYLRYIRAIYSPDSDILVMAPHRKTPTVIPLTIPPPEPPSGFMHTPPCIHTRQQRQSSPRV